MSKFHLDTPVGQIGTKSEMTIHINIEISCPQEILLGLHLDAEQFADLVRQEAAMSLFRDGKISSGMASRWLGVSRVSFLFQATKEGATLLENNQDDFDRETSLLCTSIQKTHHLHWPLSTRYSNDY